MSEMTKTEIRTQEKESEKDRHRRKTKARQDAAIERDSALHHVNSVYLPKIEALKNEHRNALKEVWDNWREQRSKAT